MSRPIYETAENRQSESSAARIIEEKLGLTVVQNKRLYPADYSFIKNGVVKGIGEIKVRKNPRFKYSTFFISADKITKCKAFSQEFGIPFFLFVWWSDGLYTINLTDKKPLHLAIGGRYDRGDSQDVEPMAHYDPADFVLVWAIQ